MSDWTTEYLTMLDDCEKREDRVTSWADMPMGPTT